MLLKTIVHPTDTYPKRSKLFSIFHLQNRCDKTINKLELAKFETYVIYIWAGSKSKSEFEKCQEHKNLENYQHEFKIVLSLDLLYVVKPFIQNTNVRKSIRVQIPFLMVFLAAIIYFKSSLV